MELVATPLYRYIVRYACILLLSPEETEDIAVILIEKHANGRSSQEYAVFLALPLTTHLRQDVKCDILDYRRTVARRHYRECSYSNVDEASPALSIAASRRPTEQIETRLLFLAFLKRLSPDQSVCIRLRYIDELDSNEVAARLGLSPAAVDKRIQRGLKRMRHGSRCQHTLST